MNATARQAVLVTGASGFIGRRLARRLLELNRRVFCLVRTGSQSAELRSGGANLLSGDVTDRATIERALMESGASTVFHLAGRVRAQRWGSGADDFMNVNAGGAEVVARACAGRDEPPVLVVVSSVAAAGPSAADRLRVESDVPAPVSDYGRSKLAGEHAVATHARTVPITIVRPPIVFGPGDRAVLMLFRLIERLGAFGVPGAGDQRLSLIHVDDVVGGLILAAEKGERVREQGSPGQGIYYMAAEEQPTFMQLGQAIAEALGKKPPMFIHLPRPVLGVVGISGDVTARIRSRVSWISTDKFKEMVAGSWACSSAKARTHLGWSPEGTLGHRLRETAAWYREKGWL